MEGRLTPWRNALNTTGAARKRWHASMRSCQPCNQNAEKSKAHYCNQHRRWLDEVEREENRAVIAKAAALPPLPKPPPLPPRKPRSYE